MFSFKILKEVTMSKRSMLFLFLNIPVFFIILNAQDTTHVSSLTDSLNQVNMQAETQEESIKKNIVSNDNNVQPKQNAVDIVVLRQSIKDSLQFNINEKFNQQFDSLVQDFAQKQQKILNKYNIEREQYANKIKTLADSLKRVNSSIYSLEPDDKDYDKVFESKYFQYVIELKENNKKQGFFNILKFGSSNIIEYKIQEMMQYVNYYFPGARCAEVQDLIIQVLLEEKKYSEAEIEFIKFIYFYIDANNYANVVDKYKNQLRKISYYKDRIPFIIKTINIVSKDPDIAIRYYTFIDLLNSYPNENVREKFPEEAKQFLSLYPGFEKTAEIIFSIAEYHRINKSSQKAYIAYGKVQTFFPENILVPQCLFNQAQIEENELKQYKKAIEKYRGFINKYPNDKLVEKAAYRIPEIYSNNLKDWQKAVEAYKNFSVKFKDSDQAIVCLQKAAQVLYKEIKKVEAAVEIFELIDQKYPNTEAARDALYTSGDLYAKQKYYKSAIEQYTKLFTKYMQSEQGRKGMEHTALIYLEKLEDKENALKILNMIIENYPGTQSAKQAEKRLESLTKE